MGRYFRILIALFLLAAIYHQIGGFEGPGTDLSPSDSAAYADSPARKTLVEAGEPPTQGSETAVPGNWSDQNSATLGTRTDDDAPALSVASAADSSNSPSAIELQIGRNESFYVALSNHGLPHETIMQLVAACKPHTNLKRVKRGDRFQLQYDPSGEFMGLSFEIDAAHYLTVTRGDGAMLASLNSYPVERVVRGVHGVIETNLFDALLTQEADPLLADEIASILGWNIDFFRDLRVGDEFSVLYEKFVYDGRTVREGHVLSCRFTNQNKLHEAYLFESPLGLPSYYDGDGNSLERQFLRAPLKYSRISSGFTRRRLHPVTKTVQPHYGVDYVAPSGTPVLATADGVVINREKNRASGNFVGLRHGQGYESYYLHLSRFPKDAQVGDRVKQGDVIGYVGSTGWATASHLDYRIKKDGRWTNPRTLDLPPAEPIQEASRVGFERQRDQMLALLDEIMGVDNFVLDSSRPEHDQLQSYFAED
jgi:murein DD-endopeptidase MepM/ murein hydrolase activator NlpD